MPINEDWKKIPKGMPVDFVCYMRSKPESEMPILKCFVAAIDPAIGITVEYIDQDKAAALGSRPRPDGVRRAVCLNINSSAYTFDKEAYEMHFNEYVKDILAGKILPRTGMVNKTGCYLGSRLSACAFS